MYSDIAANKRRTVFIMLFFLIFVGAIIYVFDLAFAGGNLSILYFGLASSLIYVLITYFLGSKMALALNRAQKIDKKDNPELYRIVENLTIADGLPMPQVYIVNDPAPNAFATGRDKNHAAVCVTSGLLGMMNKDELEGVLAHELSHIKNYDMRVNMTAFALSAIISVLADIIIRIVFFGGLFGNDREEGGGNQLVFILGLIAAILAPLVAMFIQMAVSRQREYLADASGALVTRYPEGLASALEKIGGTSTAMQVQNTSTAHLFFANPLKKHAFSNLFSTHPPIQDRINRLRKMEGHA